MTMSRGKVIAIMGGSGSGKTTLLRLIGGAIVPVRGLCESRRQNRAQAEKRRAFSVAPEDEHVISVRRFVYGSVRVR